MPRISAGAKPVGETTVAVINGINPRVCRGIDRCVRTVITLYSHFFAVVFAVEFG